MIDKSQKDTVYLEGGEIPEAIPIANAQYSIYSDKRGDWLLLLIRCPDYRHIEIGIPVGPEFSLSPGDVLRGVAYDETLGGWLTNMYYDEHFGLDDVILSVDSVDDAVAAFSVTGRIIDSGLHHGRISLTTVAQKNNELRKSFT
jgi:hypothetical protein